MRRDSILMIWIGGFGLAIAIYTIGPDRFADMSLNAIDTLDEAFHTSVATLGAKASGLIRSLAIAMYIVFAVLAFASAQKTQRGMGSLIATSILLAIMLWRPWSYYPAPIGSWLIGLALTAAGAINMTKRLALSAPQDPMPPYPPGGRR